MIKIDKTKTVIGWIDKSKAQWIRKEDLQTSWYECSECGECAENNNFCPNCGARMVGDAE